MTTGTLGASVRTGSPGLVGWLLGIGLGAIRALGASALSGLLAAIFMPRGPVTRSCSGPRSCDRCLSR